MKIGIMQPYFVPYIGYWQLINAVDKYVVFDDVNFINRGWINRNRVLINGEPHYYNIQMIGASQNKLINEIRIDNTPKVKNKNLKIIENAYKKAPYFDLVYPLIERTIQYETDHLSDFVFNSIKEISEFLKIKTVFLLSSELEKDNSLRGQEKILDICKLLGATEYLNAIGGQELYSYKDFADNNIHLKFLKTDEIVYKQFSNKFVSNLSIIDVMMFNSLDQIEDFLNMYTLISD